MFLVPRDSRKTPSVCHKFLLLTHGTSLHSAEQQQQQQTIPVVPTVHHKSIWQGTGAIIANRTAVQKNPVYSNFGLSIAIISIGLDNIATNIATKLVPKIVTLLLPLWT